MMAKAERKPAVGFIFVTFLLAIMGGTMLIPVLPGLLKEFEQQNLASASQWYGWVVGMYALMQFVGSPLLGALSDRYGRRRVLLIALTGASIDYVILALAPNLAWLFIARMISGLTAGVQATTYAYVADVTPPEKRGHAFGLIGAAFALGIVIGPALGGLLGKFDLRLPFWVAAGLSLCNGLYGAFVLPESLKPEHRRAFDWKRANPIGALLALRRYPNVLGLAAPHFLFWVGQTLLHGTWVLYVGHRFGWSTAEVGVSFTLVGLCSAFVQAVVAKKLIPKLGETRAVAIGYSVIALSFLCYGFATQGWMIYTIIVCGAISGVAGPAFQSYLTRHVAANEQGAVQGAFGALMSVASVVGLPVGAWSFGKIIELGAPRFFEGIAFFEASLLTVLALLLVTRSFRRDREREAARPTPSATA